MTRTVSATTEEISAPMPVGPVTGRARHQSKLIRRTVPYPEVKRGWGGPGAKVNPRSFRKGGGIQMRRW
eukprot:110876-Hanusia_phi.AAC.1